MIELNLLPPQEKKILVSEQVQRWLIFYGASILGIVFVFVILLLIIWFFILIQLKTTTLSLETNRASFQGQNLKTQQNLAKETNQQLERLARIQKSHKYLSGVLKELAQLIPAGVRLDTFSLDGKNQVTLSGYAERREQVISLKDALEKSKTFENIESPLANLVKQTDINFNFKFGVRPPALTK